MRLQAITAASMKMTAFWDLDPCNLVEIDQRFRAIHLKNNFPRHGCHY
jgi:hypothetical protein